MNYALPFFVPLAIGYLLGSIPFGYIVGKAHGIDLTAEGSGSTGTTNALRLLGKKAAFLVLLGDFGKGVLGPILAEKILLGLAPGFFSERLYLIALAQVIAAIAVLFGHSKSVWIGFKGGKSVASGVGTLFALDWRVGLLTAIVWATTVFTSKFSSLGALIAVPLSPIIMFVFKKFYSTSSDTIGIWIYVGYCLLGAAFIVWKHKANIERLMNGTEPKIGKKAD